jgi:hypothetical protein
MTTFNGAVISRLAQLNGDGTLDASFISGFSQDGSTPYVSALLLQPDDKVMVGGRFISYAGRPHNSLLRLQPTAPLALSSAVSRKAHGAAGTFDIPLPGVESRGSAGNHTMVVFFNNEVVSGSATVSSGVGSVSGSPTFTGNMMTISLAGVADAQNLTVTLQGVTDSFGQTLPPTAITMGVLIGDTNGDRTVNSGDALQTRSRSGETASATNFRSDVNGDGSINTGDALLVRGRSGNSLP